MSVVTWKGRGGEAQITALAHAGEKAAHARRNRTRQRDGANGLGDDRA
jgi:hypothetical protein